MENIPLQVGSLDIVLAALLLLFTVRGLVRGIVPELSGVLSILLALFAAGNRSLHNLAASWLDNVLPDSGWSDFVAYIVIFLAVFIIVRMLFQIVENLVTDKAPGWIDRLLGGAAGAVKGFAACTILLFCLAYIAPESSFRQTSVLAPYLDSLWGSLSELSDGMHKLPDLSVPQR